MTSTARRRDAGPADRGRLPSVPGQWQGMYRRRLIVADTALVTASVFLSQWMWLGSGSTELAGLTAVNYTTVSLALVVAWLVVLALFNTRAPRLIGHGPSEYLQIVTATVRLFGSIAILSLILKVDFSRGYLLIALPLGLGLLLLGRRLWRSWLWRRRACEECMARVLLVGSVDSCAAIARDLSANRSAGYLVVGACVPEGSDAAMLERAEVPVTADLDRVLLALAEHGADTVLVAGNEQLSADRVRAISWQLERDKQHLIVAPSLIDIGGPRISIRPVAGLPLLHVETPRFEGRQVVYKRVFDILGSGALLVVLSPVFLVLALLVKATSAGPVFYRQERVGKDGEPFRMIKFRSMRLNADAELQRLLQAQGTADKPLFKVQNDPRLTRIGAVLRKYSLDELPQLINVWKGDMSLVGPRPQREGEVALYDDAARRRLMVKPGMSGLWQVSGRSNLEWEEAIRLDLYYVENWSIWNDIAILGKTIREVVSPSGAY